MDKLRVNFHFYLPNFCFFWLDLFATNNDHIGGNLLAANEIEKKIIKSLDCLTKQN